MGQPVELGSHNLELHLFHEKMDLFKHVVKVGQDVFDAKVEAV